MAVLYCQLRRTPMRDTKPEERMAWLLLGGAIGAVVALLLAPESGARTRRRIRRKAEDAADYFVEASKELAERCENLYGDSKELVGDAGEALSEKCRDVYERGRRLADEATTVLSRVRRS
jgi:gas vesicle protein